MHPGTVRQNPPVSQTDDRGETGAGPPPARPSATLVLVRDAAHGVEVLVLKRATESRFAPRFVVFPGGAVEPPDRQLALAWFGNGRDVFRAAAVRELAEETALAVTGGGVRSGRSPENALELVAADPPGVDQLPEMAHWVAPDFLPRRFDTRFFIVPSEERMSTRPDGLEIESAWWSRPADVLQEFRLWESLMWPTYRTLEALAGCADVAQALELRVAQEPPPEELARLRSPEWNEAEAEP